MEIGDFIINKRKDYIGGGGNAKVYRVADGNSEDTIALKVLITGGKYFDKKIIRFKDEVKVVVKNQKKLPGILPIIDHGFCDEKKEYWYTMPIATPINNLEINSIDSAIEVVLVLSNHLIKIHEVGIYHRDIKPSNLYFYQQDYCFGDFGLVDYPEKEDLTELKESVGAKATIAPEMKWDSTNSDGSKADVYSLAKTLWMLLTNKTYSFEGMYDRNSSIMGLRNYFHGEHLVELENLLFVSTKESPEERPSIIQFSKMLTEYQETKKDYKKYNRSQWNFVQEQLFSEYTPERATWTNVEKIISVLNLIAEMPSLNHMFYPTGGGDDLVKVEKAGEDGFIYLITGTNTRDIVKPKTLYVENFNGDFGWSYFRLDLEEVAPVFYTEEIEREFLTEDYPGHYESPIVGNYGHYEDGRTVPKGAKLINRYLKGAFVFFAKNSIYNQISVTYDGNHNLVDNEVFRDYIKYLKSGVNTMFNLIVKKDLNIDLKRCLNLYANLPFGNDTEVARNLNYQTSVMKVVTSEIYKKNRSEEDLFQEMEDAFLEDENQVDISEYDFSSVLDFTRETTESAIVYSIKWIRDHFDSNQDLYLNDKGKFVSSSEAIFKSNSILEIIKIYDDCKEIYPTLSNKLFTPMFDISMTRLCPPKNVVTREQIKKVLINGDDSVGNVLVIDEDGYPQLLNQSDKRASYYPVRIESFSALNNYVGQYSVLNHLEDSYLMCLKGWRQHLSNERTIYVDYCDDVDETDELSKIKNLTS
ncbi:protein kinase domain-containing protein [Vagococcus fluvialis]|uniref:protein kinase domain-containing protein n=1 Tax=Vagococcus fluvialis TaxID=2738 RepID=UPI00378EA3D6